MIFDARQFCGSRHRIRQSLLLSALLTGCFLVCASCRSTGEPDNTSSANETSSGSPIVHLKVPGGAIALIIVDNSGQIPEEEISNWVLTSAKAISTYFGTFPVRRVTITITVTEGVQIQDGVTTQDGIAVKVGRGTRQEDFAEDWIMT